MIRYRRDPHGGLWFIEADPADVMAIGKQIRPIMVYRWGIPENDAEDLVQEVAWVTIRALSDGVIRGGKAHPPRATLFAFMSAVAWNMCQNYRRLFKHTREVVWGQAEDQDRVGDATDQDERMTARELLDKLQAYPAVLALLVAFAESAPKVEGKSRGAAYYHANRARRWIKRVWSTGLWQEPPMPQKPTPWKRKGKR